jgi:hypothetical protein
VKLTIEIDTDAVATKMLELGAVDYQFTGEFWDAMFELHPDMMHTVYNEAMRLARAVQAVEDAGREDVLKRAWFTMNELNERFGGSKV